MTTLAPTEEPQHLGAPIRGPSALTGETRRFFHLAFNIARNDWKLRFYGSALGLVWQLVRPLMLFGVLYVFFVVVSRVGHGGGASDADYGTQLLGSIVLYTFFAEASAGAVRSVVDHEGIVRKIQFPRLVIPVSVVLFASFNLCLNLVVVFIFALIEGVSPMISWLELPLLCLMLGVLAMGLAMLLSAGFVYFRDIQPIWDVVNQVLFYASPVIISYTVLQQKLSGHRWVIHLYEMNPLAVAFQQFRHAFVTHATPSAGEAMGGWVYLLIPLGIVFGIFALGFVVFNRVAPKVAENL